MTGETRGPFLWRGSQYTLVQHWQGYWELQNINHDVLAKFYCKALHVEQSTGRRQYLWTCNGAKVGNDPANAVNTWLAAHESSAA